MTKLPDAKQLAKDWITCWNEGRPDDIPLAADFVHTSPFGRVEGRDTYLEWVKPLSAASVTSLKIRRIIGDTSDAAIHFEMRTQKATIEVCDWVTVSDGEIIAIHSFYDATALRSGT